MMPFFIAFPYPQVYVNEAPAITQPEPASQAPPLELNYVFDPETITFEKVVADPLEPDRVEE